MPEGMEDLALPEVIKGDHGLGLRIWSTADAESLRTALAVSDDEFRDWLPGVLNDTRDIGEFLLAVRELFDAGSACLYAVTVAGEVVGQCSVHQQDGGQGLVGYWVRSDRTGNGVATSALALLTAVALKRGYRRLELRCDAGNERSAAVARRAGYSYVSTIDVPGTRTPAQTGREMIWQRDRHLPHS